jgi:hypothetical protein
MSDFDYHVHTDLNLIEVHPSGVVQVSDIVSYAQQVLSLDFLKKGTIEYYDLSEMTSLDTDYKSVRGLAALLEEWISHGWQGSVFSTPRESQFGMIRMIGGILESIQDAPAVVMIPRREPTALGEVRDLISEIGQVS